ncbi:TRAP transporter large permease [Hylemonella gracilis]|uniref:TRAP transporter large permease n=1 Tax=Hylemonella gracilis TaxID=80880 RepID=UPI0006840B13|nr:TRAP transporter large permease subunit [Hylemonella gracilis]
MTLLLAFALGLLILCLLALRQPLLIILLLVSAFLHLAWGRGHLEDILEDMWIGLDKELILAIPMFLLCGEVMTRGSSARRLMRIMAALTRPLPGGLAVACVLSCAVFASISGSAVVTMLAVGSVMVPSMLASGYGRRFTLGAVMAGGTLGIIIPPSIPLLLYGMVTQTSVTDLFLVGVGPGLLLTFVLAAYAVWVNRHMDTQSWDGTEVFASLRAGVWAALMPVILLGGIYTGWFTATESATAALAYALLVETLIHRELRWPALRGLLLDTARLCGALLPLLAVALGIGLFLAEYQLAHGLVGWAQGWISSPWSFLLAANLLLLGVGCLMGTVEAILIFAPLLAPMAQAYGVDPVLFGLIMILNLEIGYLTPPVGLNLIVAMGAFKQPFGLLCRAALPFILLLAGCLALVIWQPWIAMGLLQR